MIEQRLYLELLFVGTILLGILFINNIFLYKQKLRDRISLMLIFGVVMSLCEITWTVCEIYRNPGMNWLLYIGVYGYYIAFVIFAAILDRYLLERIGIRLKKAGVFLLYVLPAAAFTLLCLSTPLSRLVLWINETGGRQ